MEFQAVILCGEGRNLSPFSAVRASGTCKPLLPIANRPMISYALDWCNRGSFQKIIVAVADAYHEELKSYIDQVYNAEHKSDSNPVPIEVVQVHSRHSGEVLVSLADRITSDFVVVPCDFITDVDPQVLTNVHRRSVDSDMLITGIYYKNNLETIDKKALAASSDYIVHTPLKRAAPSTLLDSYERSAVQDKKNLELRSSMLWRHPNAVVSTSILQSSIFFCRHEVVDILTKPTTGGEVEVKSEGRSWNNVVRGFARLSWQHQEPRQKVLFYLLSAHDSVEPLFIRSNNLSAYLEANRHMMREQAKKLSAVGGVKPAPAKGSAAVGSDSTVGTGTVVGERTNIKRTVIGNGCTIGKKCRLTGCLVLDNAILEDEVVLENCIIGTSAVVHSRAKLTSCNVEGNYEVQPGTQAKNELLQNLTMESLRDEDYDRYVDDEAEEEEESDDDDDSSEGEWEASEGEGIDDQDDDGLFDRS